MIAEHRPETGPNGSRTATSDEQNSKLDTSATVSLSGILKSVWRRKLWVVASAVVWLAIGLLYLHFAPQTYESRAELLVERKGVQLDQGDLGIRQEEEFVATQARVIQSPAVVAPAIETLSLPTLGVDEDPLESITRSISINPFKDTNVLEVLVRRQDAEEAYEVLNAVVTHYREFLQEDDHNTYRETLKILTENEQKLRNELKSLKSDYARLRENSPLIGQEKDPAELQKTLLTDLGQSIVKTKGRRIELENQIEAWRQAKPELAVELKSFSTLDGGQTTIQKSMLTNIGTAIVDAKNRQVELRSQIEICSATHPELAIEFARLRTGSPLMGEGHNDIAGVQKALLAELGRSIIAAQNERIELEHRIEACEKTAPELAVDFGAFGGEARDQVGVKRALLTNLGRAFVEAKDHRIELEQQISAYKASYDSSLQGGGRPSSGNNAEIPSDASILGLVDQQETATVRAALFAAQSQERELSQKYGEKHPDLRAIRKQIVGWETRINEITGAAIDRLQQELDAARQQEQQLKEEYAEEANAVKDSVLEQLRKVLESTRKREQELVELYQHNSADAKEAVLTHLNKELEATADQQHELTALFEKDAEQAKESIVNHLETELTALQKQEEQLESLYQQEFRQAKVADADVIKGQHLQDDIQRVQSLHDSVLARLKDWQLTEQTIADGRSEVKVTVLENPSLANHAAWPISSIVLGISGFLGLLCGLGIVTVAERIDTRVQSPNDVRRRIDTPVISEIPQLPGGTRPLSKFVRRGRLAHELPDSNFTEAIRGLRTRMQNGAAHPNGLVMQLTSARDGEGKTTLASNLAFSFAQLGKKVIMVDADLRNGVLHEIFETPNDRGLVSVLNETVPLHDAICTSPLAKVDVLPRGQRASNPADLLGRESFSATLQSLRDTYDLVLIDTPAIFEFAEASIVAPKTDGVVLSVMVGKSSASEIQKATDLLQSLGSKVSGIVINGVHRERRQGQRMSRASAT